MASASVELAENVARKAHSGMFTKTGEDYINHPRRVVANVREIPDWTVFSDAQREILECAAWLHDVVEDSPDFTLESLLQAGIPADAVACVGLLSKNLDAYGNELEGHVYEVEYLARIRSHPLALRVKLADLADNSNLARVATYDILIAAGAVEPRKDPDRYARYRQALDPEGLFDEWFERRIQIDPASARCR
jgi:(p)ppGpp synthase/HD superfamily hydrolase